MALGIAVFSPVAAWGLQVGGMDEKSAQAISAAVGALLSYKLIQRARRRSERTAIDLLHGRINDNPVAVMVLFGLTLVLLEMLIGFAIGVAVGATTSQLGLDPTAADVQGAMAGPVAVVLLPILLVASVPLSKYASHRLGARPFWWLVGGIVISRVLSALTFLLTVEGGNGAIADPSLLIAPVVLGLFMVGAAYLGLLWARRAHESYAIAVLFRRLNPADRASLIELVGESPTAKQAKVTPA